MENILEKYLKKFDSEKDKISLGVELLSKAGIHPGELLDFDFLEKKFNIKLTDGDKFKLKHIYKNISFIDNEYNFSVEEMEEIMKYIKDSKYEIRTMQSAEIKYTGIVDWIKKKLDSI